MNQANADIVKETASFHHLYEKAIQKHWEKAWAEGKLVPLFRDAWTGKRLLPDDAFCFMHIFSERELREAFQHELHQETILQMLHAHENLIPTTKAIFESKGSMNPKLWLANDAHVKRFHIDTELAIASIQTAETHITTMYMEFRGQVQ
ncbi:hypothetical protein A3SI_11989 [Nitritalea halalkaliphila LW7]|uniref:Uncharacterized protein n=1 Tax=Nitritalea halalkaliphila LW7 TaxID=1189621 RepID=I5C1Y5_9BACT|nr:hypothetical protein [Nitritalea halalkaliphila]EIM75837.1 hypothetical protein A3SI_11989 [Nitritalea halalkaliphila LW7]